MQVKQILNYRTKLNLAKIILGIVLMLSCIGFIFKDKFSNGKEQLRLTNQFILEWQQIFLDAERYSEGYRVPIAARTTGYIGLAAYEAALPAFNESHQSFAVTELKLNMPEYDKTWQFNLIASLNGCYKRMFDKFYITARIEEKRKALQLFHKWELRSNTTKDSNVYHRSNHFGSLIANTIFEYSETDSIGHQAYLHIYDKHFDSKIGDGMWKLSDEFPMPPLLPHWGEVRPFIIKTSEYLAAPLPEYSLFPSSIFYTEALEVFTVSSPLSLENKWIGEFWSDDHPGLTFTPSGRWISITNQVIKQVCPSIDKTLETYLKVGFALTDATIACWHSKYYYNLERPEAYINKVFDNKWKPLFHAPPFPGYPSGHSVFGASVAEVLTQLYGTSYQMEDNSHKGREEFMSKPRMFHSFYEMAFENAFSRISLGVHFRMDCEEGLRLGFQIGKKVSEIELTKQQYSYNK